MSRDFLRLCDNYFESFCTSIRFCEQLARERGREQTVEYAEKQRMCVVKAMGKSKKLRNLQLLLVGSSEARLQRTCNSLLRSLCLSESRLTSLTLLNVDCSLDTLPCFSQLGEHSGSLRELHIEAMSLFDDECLKELMESCRLIVKLVLKSLPKLIGTHLEEITGACPQLQELNVNN